MRQFHESELEELKLRFKAVYEYDEKIEKYKDETKLCNAGKKETFKALAEKLEVPQKILKKAYKEYVESIQDPEGKKEVDDIVVFIQEFNLIKK
jgi:hypothetical protein